MASTSLTLPPDHIDTSNHDSQPVANVQLCDRQLTRPVKPTDACFAPQSNNAL